MHLLLIVLLQQQNAPTKRLGPRAPLRGSILQLKQQNMTNAYEISESLGPELYIQATAGEEESEKWREEPFPRRVEELPARK